MYLSCLVVDIQSCAAGPTLLGAIHAFPSLFDGVPEGRLTDHVARTVRRQSLSRVTTKVRSRLEHEKCLMQSNGHQLNLGIDNVLYTWYTQYTWLV